MQLVRKRLQDLLTTYCFLHTTHGLPTSPCRRGRRCRERSAVLCTPERVRGVLKESSAWVYFAWMHGGVSSLAVMQSCSHFVAWVYLHGCMGAWGCVKSCSHAIVQSFRCMDAWLHGWNECLSHAVMQSCNHAEFGLFAWMSGCMNGCQT